MTNTSEKINSSFFSDVKEANSISKENLLIKWSIEEEVFDGEKIEKIYRYLEKTRFNEKNLIILEENCYLERFLYHL